jgi:hypothetical protein
MDGMTRIKFPTEAEIFLSTTTSRPATGLIHHPSEEGATGTQDGRMLITRMIYRRTSDTWWDLHSSHMQVLPLSK